MICAVSLVAVSRLLGGCAQKKRLGAMDAGWRVKRREEDQNTAGGASRNKERKRLGNSRQGEGAVRMFHKNDPHRTHQSTTNAEKFLDPFNSHKKDSSSKDQQQ